MKIPDDLWIKIWARTGCSTPKFYLNNTVFSCETGDCGPLVECALNTTQLKAPVTIAEFNLTEYSNEYKISLIDGFNIPISIFTKDKKSVRPGGLPIIQNWCENILCDNKTISEACSEELVKLNSKNQTIGCLRWFELIFCLLEKFF